MSDLFGNHIVGFPTRWLRLIFVTFSQFELSHFLGIFTMKMKGQWVPCVRNSYSFMPIHLKLYMCYGHGHNLNLVIFSGILVNGCLVVIFEALFGCDDIHF